MRNYLFNYRSDYFQKLPNSIQKAFASDDAASFMINMQICGKKVCDTLVKMVFDYWKPNILNELINKYPKHCTKIMVRCLEALKIKKSMCEFLKLFHLLESKHPGIVKETADEYGNDDEDNLKALRWFVNHTDSSGMLKPYLLDLGVQCVLEPPRLCVKNPLLLCGAASAVKKLCVSEPHYCPKNKLRNLFLPLNKGANNNGYI